MQGAHWKWSEIAALFRRRIVPVQPGNPRLRWRFWVLCAGLIAVAVGQAGYTIWEERQTALELQRRDVANVSLVLAAQTSRYLDVFDSALKKLQQRLAVASDESVEAFRTRLSGTDVRSDMADLIRNVPGDPALLLVDAGGRLVNFTRAGPIPNISAADRDYFAHFRDRDDPDLFFGTPAKGRVTGKWTLFMSRRLRAADGQFLGVVVAAVIIDDLVGFYRLGLGTRKAAVTLLRTDGLVLARYPDPETSVGTSMPKTSPWYGVVANKGGTYRSPGFFGAPPSIVNARLLDGYPLVIDDVVSEQEAFAIWHSNTLLHLVGTIIVSLSLLALFKVIERQLRHQNELVQFADTLIAALPGAFVVVELGWPHDAVEREPADPHRPAGRRITRSRIQRARRRERARNPRREIEGGIHAGVRGIRMWPA